MTLVIQIAAGILLAVGIIRLAKLRSEWLERKAQLRREQRELEELERRREAIRRLPTAGARLMAELGKSEVERSYRSALTRAEKDQYDPTSHWVVNAAAGDYVEKLKAMTLDDYAEHLARPIVASKLPVAGSESVEAISRRQPT